LRTTKLLKLIFIFAFLLAHSNSKILEAGLKEQVDIFLKLNMIKLILEVKYSGYSQRSLTS